MIEVNNISKLFGQVMAVKDVSFEVADGETLGFLGPNGAGKTTTMRILAGFFPPTSGTVKIGGKDVFQESLAVRRMIGYLPENVPVYGDMPVSDYLSFVAEVKGLSRAARKKSVGEAVESCGLGSVEGRMIKKISKGFRQRVGLAQALVGDPRLLILDEPTIGLDPQQISEIRNLIRGFSGKKTIILSTHILPEVSMTCDRVAIIREGRVIAMGTPGELSAEMSGGSRLRLRTNGPVGEVKERLSKVAGVVGLDPGSAQAGYIMKVERGDAVQARVAAAVVQSGWDLYELTPITASLEDVFLELVTRESGASEEEEAE
jgi:ABC-2 type transport system ATP-binding protein